jgi:hypothetical protein
MVIAMIGILAAGAGADEACPSVTVAEYDSRLGARYRIDTSCTAFPHVGVGDVTLEEPSQPGALAAMRFPVTLDRPLADDLELYANLFLPGPAPAPIPYASAADVRLDLYQPNVTIPAGRLHARVTVWIRGDGVPEPTLHRGMFEYFSISVFGMSQPITGPRSPRVGLRTPNAVGFIADAHTDVQLVIGDISVWEPDVASAEARVPVMLTRPLDHDVTLSYTTRSASDIDRDPAYPPWEAPATAGRDYLARSGTTTIPAGTSTSWIQVWIRGDEAPEVISSEQFHIVITDVEGATFTPGAGGLIAIRDADG